MLDQFSAILGKKCLIRETRPVLLGISGGIDSICMLDLFERSQIPVVVAHFNHRIRPEAARDARFVEQAAHKYGFPFALGDEPVPQYAQEHNLSLEEAARIKRYHFLFNQAERYSCQAVAVAHNADDQVETVIMHLLRGSGLEGLKGMAFRTLPNPWSDSIPLLRPLLCTWRSEIEAYCQARGLNSMVDQTNLDTRLLRNRLRHELLPELDTYIPGVRKRIWQMADLLQEEDQVLEDIAKEYWAALVDQSNPDAVAFKQPGFSTIPLGLRRRLVRQALKMLTPEARDIDFAIVKRVLDFAEEPTQSGQADIGMGLRVLSGAHELVLTRWGIDPFLESMPQINIEMQLQIPGVLELRNGWRLQVDGVEDQLAAVNLAIDNPDPYQAWMALNPEQHDLSVRGRVAGDVFKPLGMGGKKMKLSDFMVNVKMPRFARAGWPLICVGDEIAWVPGYRLAHPYRLGKVETGKVIHLQVHRL